MSSGCGDSMEAQYIRRHHRHEPRENQCTSALVRHVKAPVHLVSGSIFGLVDLGFELFWVLGGVDLFDFWC